MGPGAGAIPGAALAGVGQTAADRLRQGLPQQQQQQQPQAVQTMPPGAQQQQQYRPRTAGQTPVTMVYGSGVSPPTMYQGVHNDPSNVFPNSPYTPAADLFMAQQLRSRFIAQPPSRATTITVTSSQFSQFQTIYNIEPQPAESSMIPGLVSSAYLTTNRFNGKQVVLRRLINLPVDAREIANTLNVLKHFRHPNLVPLHNITPTQEFVLGSNDIVMEYRYIKGARSALDVFFPRAGPNGLPVAETSDMTEGLAWSIACQLIGLIRTMHETETPLRGLHISKLLYSDICGRVYVSGLGLRDVHELATTAAQPSGAARPSFEDLRRRDIIDLGQVLAQLVTRNLNPSPGDLQALARSMRFSPSFFSLISACLEGKIRIADLCRGLGERLSMEVGHQQGYADLFYSDCSKELHNGRLMRMMIKLNFVISSSQALSMMDYDTEDRYALRLLHNYLFNQVDDNQRPRIDWGHVYATLNKLDCGSDDLVQLVSNEDHQALLVISFRDLRDILQRTFDGLLNEATSTAASLVATSVASPQLLVTPMTPMGPMS